MAEVSITSIDEFAIPAGVSPDSCGSRYERETRAGIIERKRVSRARRGECQNLLRRKSTVPEEKHRLYSAINDCLLEERHLEDILQSNFVPQHSPRQLISPRAFLQSPLFRVASRSASREQQCERILGTDSNGFPISYAGPELRQEDGLVFMSLLNSVRDLRVGTLAHFTPGEMCRALFNHYDGRSRERLKNHILRLLKGQIRTHTCAVQLCSRFDFPSRGMWSVSLAPDIVKLFANANVWLDLKTRLDLPDGLATWLYGYVESQTRLIPIRVETVKRMCGTDADGRAFTNLLRIALRHLNTHKLIDPGYQIKDGLIRWRKPLLQGPQTERYRETGVAT